MLWPPNHQIYHNTLSSETLGLRHKFLTDTRHLSCTVHICLNYLKYSEELNEQLTTHMGQVYIGVWLCTRVRCKISLAGDSVVKWRFITTTRDISRFHHKMKKFLGSFVIRMSQVVLMRCGCGLYIPIHRTPQRGRDACRSQKPSIFYVL